MNGRYSTRAGTSANAEPSSRTLRKMTSERDLDDWCAAGSGGTMKPEDVTEEVLQAERAVMLQAKQARLEEIYERHDSMVRELFHLHEYKLMLTYDPHAAKADNSQDFVKYKTPYDLIEKVEQQASPAKRTRGARSEKLASGFPLSPTKQRPLKRNNSKNGKSKLSPLAIHDIISSTQGKDVGKKSRHAKDKVVEEAASTSDASPLKTRSKKSKLKAEEERSVLSTIDVHQSIPTIPSSVSAPPARRTRAKDPIPAKAVERKSVELPGKESVRESVSTVLGRRSSRLRGDSGFEPPAKRLKVSVEEPSNHETIKSKSTSHIPKSVTKLSKTKASQLDTPASSESATPNILKHIKRVKLLVTPSLSHHKQRPPPPKFKRSLNRFLASYRTFGGEEIDDEKFVSAATAEARIRVQEADFRRQGRFIPGTDVLFGSDPNVAAYDPPNRTTRDVWDDIIQEVAIAQSRRPKKSAGQQVSSQIASKVQAYWDVQEVKRDRARAQDQKKLKILAKSTMKMVNAEWKKAVYHVREQNRQKLEAEERRRGHEHLDAILDQSGQLLETQQGDLTRARSLSSGWDPEADEWGQGDDDGSETDEASLGVSDDEETGVGASSQIELDDEALQSSIRESSDVDEAEEEEGEEEEEEDIGTNLLLGPVKEASVDSPRPGPEDGEIELSERGMLLEQSPQQDADRAIPIESLPPTPLEPTSPGVEKENSLEDGVICISPLDKSALNRAAMEVDGDQVEDVDRVEIDDERGAVPREEEEGEDSATMARTEEEEEGEEEALAGAVTDKPTVIQKAVDLDAAALVDGEVAPEDDVEELEGEAKMTTDVQLPEYLHPFAVTPGEWDVEEKVKPPALLRGVLRPYQQTGLEWLASLHTNNLNGILADEMGLGKTIQTIALLAHLACDRGIWGPHLIIVPTSVLLNWEMEFKKFLPGFKVLGYYGTTKRRKELRQGWNDKYHFNVCVTSYTLASRDAHIFKRKPWYYMILDEAHMIKNFRSQRWNILLMFRSFRRLLLTGTPLQNNLTELWALLQFLMSGSNFANLKEFGDWFSNPLERAIEMGNVLDDDTIQRVTKLHTVLRPYLLRRLKRDVEKELPHKFEHLVLCPLSKRQRFLYDEFMSRAQTTDDLQSGIYQKIANILMQLRKVCNHPDLFEVRPIVTSFAMQRSAIADFEIKELLVRRRWLEAQDEKVDLNVLGYQFIDRQEEPLLAAIETRRLSASSQLPHITDLPGEPPPKDTRSIAGYKRYQTYMQETETVSRWKHNAYLNELRCSRTPIYSSELLSLVRKMHKPLLPLSTMDLRQNFLTVVQPVHKAVLSYEERAETMKEDIQTFAVVTPSVIALDLPRLALKGYEEQIIAQPLEFDQILHPASVKLHIAFPDPSLLQYDCGKLQRLKALLHEKKAGGHRVLIFTQMTRILDILEIFLSLHGYLYSRLDGATKIEDRQYITERFNADARIFCFIASSRSGGVGINLTGADTVVFYDSDFNPQMDKQCEDRAHRIGQIRDVHIYRFVSQHTVEEAMLRKANQKRSLDDIVIQKGAFDWRTIFNNDNVDVTDPENKAVAVLTKALGEFEDAEDARAAAIAAREEYAMEGADNDDFGAEASENTRSRSRPAAGGELVEEAIGEAVVNPADTGAGEEEQQEEEEEEEEGGTVVDYMLTVVRHEYDFFKDWRL